MKRNQSQRKIRVMYKQNKQVLLLSLIRMPYMLEKLPGGFKVKNKETGKTYSKKPIPKSNAEAQMRLLNLLKRK